MTKPSGVRVAFGFHQRQYDWCQDVLWTNELIDLYSCAAARSNEPAGLQHLPLKPVSSLYVHSGVIGRPKSLPMSISGPSCIFRLRHSFLSIRSIRSRNSGQFRLPFVSIRQQFLLVIQQLLARFRRILRIRALDNRIDGAALLAESTVDALCHIDIIPSRPSRTVFSLLGFNGDGLRGTNRFA